MLSPADKALVSARRTWCLASRYSNITIPVVAARSQSHSQFRVETSLNYTYLDNLTDRDSVVEIARLLSRLFPYSDVSLECSTGYPFSLKSRPSVSLGGIGTPGHPNTEFALEVFEALGIEASYSDMSLSYKSRIWHSELRRGVLTRDTGLFARVHSPMDPDARLFLVQGTHTRGVHGAAKAFSLSDIAMKNHALCQRVVGDRDFIAIFDVQIIGGDVVVPELDETAFFLL
jgi:hypothetical protein